VKPGDLDKFLLTAERIRADQTTFSHPCNPNSRIRGVPMAARLDLRRTGVSLVHIAPGKESFTYHSHHTKEKWPYVLAGRGIADTDAREVEGGLATSWPLRHRRWLTSRATRLTASLSIWWVAKTWTMKSPILRVSEERM